AKAACPANNFYYQNMPGEKFLSREFGAVYGFLQSRRISKESRVKSLHNVQAHSFASDNYSGIAPEVLAALTTANGGHQAAYGADEYTALLDDVIVKHFGSTATAYPVFNGTGANIVGLQALLPRWGAVICAATAHINVDEGGAPERMGSIKLLPVPTADGKLTPELVDREAWGFGNEHRAQPLVVSITQTTEMGICYTPEEIRALADHVHARGMALHVDGARLSNAAATLGLPLSAFTTEAGVDVLSLGGTKNGALGAEAVVVLNPDALVGGAEALPFVRKLSMQLASKMRFISAQIIALYEGDMWLNNARHSNAMAKRLRSKLEEANLPGLSFTHTTESNAVFATLPDGIADELRQDFHFYDWDATRNEVRWMCSFDTTEKDIDAFAAAIKQVWA